MQSTIKTFPRTSSRRNFLQASLAGAAAVGLEPLLRLKPTVAAPPAHDLKITRIDRVTVKVPYREIPARSMARELPHWMYSEIFTVHLQSGHKGNGETLLYYTWGATEDEDVKRAQGKNAAEIMWDDTLGAGLQMACFDAVARACDVPIHALFGNQVYDKTPLSWWNIDTSPEDMAAECKEAYKQGYMAYKTKGRPWFDVWKQIELAAKEVPESFSIDMDFNDTLLTAERGIPILKDLDQYPQVDIYETPISQYDLQGNKAIRHATHVPVAMHFGKPDPLLAIKEEICDGFIIGRGASETMRSAAVSAMADKPFWLQLVGTGITAAYSLHFGGVCSHARWPAVNCHQLYQHQLLKEPIRVKNGFAAVPDGPGLGHELDWDTIERLRIDKPRRRPDPPRMIESILKSGTRVYYANTGQVNFVLNPARRGKTPYFTHGVTTKLLPDDGSDHWRELYQKSRRRPLIVEA